MSKGALTPERLASIGWTELDAMNALQDHGIISDNCVNWEEVGNQDEAIAWLSGRNPSHQPKTRARDRSRPPLIPSCE